MFRCGICGKTSQAREKATTVVVETRAATNVQTGRPERQIVRQVLAHAGCAGGNWR